MAERTKEDLQEEVDFWRRDCAARLWMFGALLGNARERNDPTAHAYIKVNQVLPALSAWDDAIAGKFHPLCEGCNQPLRSGDYVVTYADVGDVHARCGDSQTPSGREGEHLYDDVFTAERVQEMVDLARGESARYPAANDEKDAS